MNYFVTGDCHGRIDRFKKFKEQNPNLTDIGDVGFIILGDFGVNYYLNKTDKKKKQELEELGFDYYVVRGNHEQRPEFIPDIKLKYNKSINNFVYEEEDFPHIHYLLDGEDYQFNDYSALVIGGAYSVDKYWRLFNGGCMFREDLTDEDYIKAGWFPQEQLASEEMKNISWWAKGRQFDFVFSHTCPLSWCPEDLFLKQVRQEDVDKSMEIWLDDLKDNIYWDIWCFGHYHADRLERPRVEQFFTDIESLDNIYSRWSKYKEDKDSIWMLDKSPNFNKGE